MRSLKICIPHQYYSGDKIKKNETGGECSTYWREVHRGSEWGDMRERDHLEDPGADVRVILKLIFRKWDGVWTGFMCLRIRRCEWLLRMRNEP